MAACKAFGNETVQISIAPHFLEIIQNAQRDLTHPERTTGRILGSYTVVQEVLRPIAHVKVLIPLCENSPLKIQALQSEP